MKLAKANIAREHASFFARKLACKIFYNFMLSLYFNKRTLLNTFLLKTGKFKAVDCFLNSAPAILPQAFDKNVGSVSGTEAMVEYCQEKAEKFGYKTFGIDDKGCWSADNAASVYDDYGKSNACTISKKTGNGVGAEINADIFVYQLQG